MHVEGSVTGLEIVLSCVARQLLAFVADYEKRIDHPLIRERTFDMLAQYCLRITSYVRTARSYQLHCCADDTCKLPSLADVIG